MKVRLMALLFALSLVLGLPLAASAGPATGGGDTDLDGVENAYDNCVATGNAAQLDADHDGCGDTCTEPVSCDTNGDLIIGVPDFVTLSGEFGNNCNTNPSLSCSADCNGDGLVGVPDFVTLSAEFGNQVGPSGITTAQCNPATCQCTPQ